MSAVPIRLPTDNSYGEVFRSLEERPIRYTVLKGTATLREALDGAGDIDLLVDPSHFDEAACALLDAGFKPARSLVGGDEPAQRHYFEPNGSGGWAHIHLHSAVVCSEQLRTEFLLPSMTEGYLARAREIEGVRLPGVSAEYAHLLLKVFIRFASLPDLVLAATGRWRPWPEIEAVRSRASLEEAWEVLDEAGLDIPNWLIAKCDEVLATGQISPRAVSLGWRLRRSLSGYRVDTRAGRWRDYLLIGFERARRALTGGKGRVSEFGGTVVAIVGPDAVGKSTLVEGLARRFGAHFQVQVYHGGKPRPTAKTLPLRLARMVLRRVKGKESDGLQGASSAASPPSLTRALNAWAVAEDRRATVARAQRSAAKGALVLFDRYPSQAPGGMDGPRLEILRSSSGLSGRLSRRESAIYQALTPPDLVIRLTAPVSTLVERDSGRAVPDGAAYLHHRSAPEAGWEMAGAYREVEISTEMAAEDVLERAVSETWRIF